MLKLDHATSTDLSDNYEVTKTFWTSTGVGDGPIVNYGTIHSLVSKLNPVRSKCCFLQIAPPIEFPFPEPPAVICETDQSATSMYSERRADDRASAAGGGGCAVPPRRGSVITPHLFREYQQPTPIRHLPYGLSGLTPLDTFNGFDCQLQQVIQRARTGRCIPVRTVHTNLVVQLLDVGFHLHTICDAADLDQRGYVLLYTTRLALWGTGRATRLVSMQWLHTYTSLFGRRRHSDRTLDYPNLPVVICVALAPFRA